MRNTPTRKRSLPDFLTNSPIYIPQINAPIQWATPRAPDKFGDSFVDHDTCIFMCVARCISLDIVTSCFWRIAYVSETERERERERDEARALERARAKERAREIACVETTNLVHLS